MEGAEQIRRPTATQIKLDSMLMRVALLGLIWAFVSPTAVDAATAGLTHRLDGDRLTAHVVGPERTGAWRIRIVAPNRLRRVDFVLRSGDIAWNGVIRVASRDSGSWVVIRTFVLDQALRLGTRLTGCNAGACWDTTRMRPPLNGNRTFSVTVTLNRVGSYRLSGAVRLASEAFIFGPWQSSGAVVVHH